MHLAPNLHSFYKEQILKKELQLQHVKKMLFISSMLRLSLFCIAAVLIYLFFGSTKWVLFVILTTLVLFLYLVARHNGLQYLRDKLKTLLQINHTEIAVLNRDFDSLAQGNEYKDALHYFSQDIDLFGKNSFYQYFNRTALPQGSDTLAGLLTQNSIDDIPEKQEAIKELGKLPEWRQDFLATAILAKTEISTKALLKWLKGYTAFTPALMKYLPSLFTLTSVTLGIFYFFDRLPESVLLYWLVFGLLVTGIFAKKITALGIGASKAQSIFEQYNKLLTILEDTSFQSKVLNDQKKKILEADQKTSLHVRKFSKLLSSLDQNNNIFYLILGNGFFLRGLATCHKIETWMKLHGPSVEAWFDCIAFFDAYVSLGNFAFNHPQYVFPKIKADATTINAQDAGHPLLAPHKSVLNDFHINKEEFFIITGANMAGKSTFLRTVSLQIVMANVGLPVCAKKVQYNPIKLITSMRTTDSLSDDESYFFSELKRLKFIVDEIQKDNYFIVLDEILKGTNSTDKARGSRKFVESLVASKATGIIATHDLSLCETAASLPQIRNHYFDAEIVDNELHFDYKFKDGVCQNMNASFLLKKMGIV